MNRALEHLPNTLNGTFQEAIGRIRSQPRQYASLAEQVISWIFYAKRPLKIPEVQEALAVESGDSMLDRSGIHDPELLLGVCCGMVDVGQDQAVRLTHYSFQEFLSLCWGDEVPHAKKEVTLTCVTYLAFDDFAVPDRRFSIYGASRHLFPDIFPLHPTKNEFEIAEYLTSFSFLDYAASYWMHHIAEGLEDDLILSVLKLLRKRAQFNNAIIVLQDKPEQFEKVFPANETSPLGFAAYYGLCHVIATLIEDGDDVHDDDYDTPALFYAVMQNQEPAARLLLDLGADVDVQVRQYNTPLTCAVLHGNNQIAKLFLQYGADINKQYHNWRDSYSPAHYEWRRAYSHASPICAAVFVGNVLMVDDLVQNGAVIHPIDCKSQVPLVVAAYTSHTPMVRKLLDLGADPNMIRDDGSTPLMMAAQSKNLEIAKLLLEAGADINVCNNDYEDSDEDYAGPTALTLAVSHHHLPMTKYFLEQGASIDLSKGYCGTIVETAMDCACSMDLEAILRVLIEWEVSLNASSLRLDRIKILDKAVAWKSQDLFAYLIDEGVDDIIHYENYWKKFHGTDFRETFWTSEMRTKYTSNSHSHHTTRPSGLHQL